MALLSKKDTKLITDPLSDNNPITVQVLGICSALAITAELEASVVMSVSVLFVMGVGNVIISMIRNIVGDEESDIIQASAIMSALAVLRGAKIVRVHDVKETNIALKILQKNN